MHDADDLEGGVRRGERRLRQPRNPHGVADRVAAGHARPHEAFVDERDRCRAADVGRGEEPPRRQPDAEGVRVIGADLMHFDRLVVRRFPGHVRRGPHVPHRVQPRVHAGRGDAGQRLDAPHEILEERRAPRRVGVALRRQRYPHRQHPIGRRAQLDALHGDERPQQRRRPGELGTHLFDLTHHHAALISTSREQGE